jgi:hypothetical protein
MWVRCRLLPSIALLVIDSIHVFQMKLKTIEFRQGVVIGTDGLHINHSQIIGLC